MADLTVFPITDYICTHLNTQFHFLIILLIAAIEYWLGKTTITKSGSVMELIINFLKQIFIYFTKRK